MKLDVFITSNTRVLDNARLPQRAPLGWRVDRLTCFTLERVSELEAVG